MFELRPPLLLASGLPAAIGQLLRVLAAEEGFEGVIECDFDRLPEPVELLAYRTLAELLSNVRRHATASQVSVRLALDGEVLAGEVADDGAGFDVRRALDRSTDPLHLGLDSTAERLRLAGGGLEIESTVGEGTVARLRIPLDAH
jgi:signal transduction histidine kinase